MLPLLRYAFFAATLPPAIISPAFRRYAAFSMLLRFRRYYAADFRRLLIRHAARLLDAAASLLFFAIFHAAAVDADYAVRVSLRDAMRAPLFRFRAFFIDTPFAIIFFFDGTAFRCAHAMPPPCFTMHDDAIIAMLTSDAHLPAIAAAIVFA